MKPTELVTKPVRLAFPALFEPKPVAAGETKLAYQAVLLLPPDFDKKPLMAALKAAAIEEFGNDLPKGLKLPIRDAGEKDADGYEEGWSYINVRTKFAPQVIDQRCQTIIDPERIFAGCWVRVHLNAYGWRHDQGGRGVSFSLEAVQLVREDTRLDGRREAAEVFDAIEVPEDVAASTTAEKPKAAARTQAADDLFRV